MTHIDPATPPAPRVSAVIPVYRDAARAMELVRVWQALQVSSGIAAEMILVDDGSGDGSADVLEQQVGKAATVLRLPENRGRSGACNAGAKVARGEFLLIMDCDCRPVHPDFLQRHLDGFRPGVVATNGPVVGDGRGFWHDYQARASARRAAQRLRGIWYSCSTQNMLVRRDAFEQVGGFDETYRTYGFEDRDLLLRLGALGSVEWAGDAVVEHHDALTLPGVTRKMRKAGGPAAVIFSNQHPEAYRQLGYAALDARLHPGLRLVSAVIGPVLPVLIAMAAKMLEWRGIPFGWRAAMVKALSGLSYLRGTADAPS